MRTSSSTLERSIERSPTMATTRSTVSDRAPRGAPRTRAAAQRAHATAGPMSDATGADSWAIELRRTTLLHHDRPERRVVHLDVHPFLLLGDPIVERIRLLPSADLGTDRLRNLRIGELGARPLVDELQDEE